MTAMATEDDLIQRGREIFFQVLRSFIIEEEKPLIYVFDVFDARIIRIILLFLFLFSKSVL